MLLALALTLAVELPVAVLFGLRSRPQILAVVYVNLLTNPALNLIADAVWSATPSAYMPTFVVLEVVVVMVEWRVLHWAIGGCSRRLLLLAAAMNAASVAVGLLLRLF
ncbi:MAG TPA: hypothetical protein VFH61_05630 [Thermoleophilia bacterium]|nr:hypothetical protein [Thermoleophilia bacterium]